jgi:hypothetical protein
MFRNTHKCPLHLNLMGQLKFTCMVLVVAQSEKCGIIILGVVARLSPDIVILEIGTNDLSLLPPEVVGSEIEDLVSLLQQTYHVKVVCVCLVTLCNRNPV